MTPRTIQRWVRLGEQHRVERDEVYCHTAPAHWPRDRCMVPEGDASYAKRVKVRLTRKGCK